MSSPAPEGRVPEPDNYALQAICDALAEAGVETGPIKGVFGDQAEAAYRAAARFIVPALLAEKEKEVERLERQRDKAQAAATERLESATQVVRQRQQVEVELEKYARGEVQVASHIRELLEEPTDPDPGSDEQVRCGECGGSGSQVDRGAENAEAPVVYDCPACGGSGTSKRPPKITWGVEDLPGGAPLKPHHPGDSEREEK